MRATHKYRYEIEEDDPRAEQPAAIKKKLKPHQLASIHKAMVMEREGRVYYNIQNPEQHPEFTYNVRYNPNWRTKYRKEYSMRTNVGIIGDMVGYGKTLTALGIIASTPPAEIFEESEIVHAFHSNRTNRHITFHCENNKNAGETRRLFETTLVIVPRGPVYNQWNIMLKENTKLNYLAIDDLWALRRDCPPTGTTHEELCEFFKKYDVVLIKSTNINTLLIHYEIPFQDNAIRGFQRIMIDEAHDILKKCPHIESRFTWYITASYSIMSHISSSYANMSVMVRELLTSEHVLNILVKCDNNFTKKSFDVPPYREIIYKCKIPRIAFIAQPFLTQNIMDMVNANDIAGAVRELGGNVETEDNILTALTRNINRDINNRKREKDYVEVLDISADAKEARLRTITAEIERLEQRKVHLEERIRTMTEDACAICFDTVKNPIMLPCTHGFCGECIMSWMEASERTGAGYLGGVHRCPTCREPVHDKKNLTAIVKKGEKAVNEEVPEEGAIMTKEKTLLSIIEKKPAGKFLIFSDFEVTFYKICDELDKKQIKHSELKGTTQHMAKILERFQSGEVRVILLNTQYAGSGIDISCATDVVLFHNMHARNEQAIGRAQRVGRTTPLVVHRLYYEGEEEVVM